MILLVSEDRRFLELWRSLLREHLGPGDHAATCARLADALGLAERGRLSLCVVDTLSPLHTTLGADGELAQLARRARVLLARTEFSVAAEVAALSLGVAGSCAATLEPAELARIVEVVLKGGVWVSRQALPEMLLLLRQAAAPKPAANANPMLERLTPREREIAGLVAEGVANKVIAQRLGLSDLTVKAHLTAIFRKLGVPSRVKLALLLSALPSGASA